MIYNIYIKRFLLIRALKAFVKEAKIEIFQIFDVFNAFKISNVSLLKKKVSFSCFPNCKTHMKKGRESYRL